LLLLLSLFDRSSSGVDLGKEEPPLSLLLLLSLLDSSSGETHLES
jgi:hypothetical protein